MSAPPCVHLRQGTADLALMGLGRMSRLSLGIIDDFDSEVTPRLTVALVGVLPPCDLTLLTAPSLRILQDVAERRLDLGIAARPADLPPGLTEIPLLRDPFVLATPRGTLPGPPASIEALGHLPFLRYEQSQLIARQIAAHLARLKLNPAGRIEIDSNLAVFGLVADGAGWTITTAVSYLRARRFHGEVDLHPLPFAAFARTISLFHASAQVAAIPALMATSLRRILQTQVIEPGQRALPWIGQGLALLPVER